MHVVPAAFPPRGLISVVNGLQLPRWPGELLLSPAWDGWMDRCRASDKQGEQELRMDGNGSCPWICCMLWVGSDSRSFAGGFLLLSPPPSGWLFLKNQHAPWFHTTVRSDDGNHKQLGLMPTSFLALVFIPPSHASLLELLICLPAHGYPNICCAVFNLFPVVLMSSPGWLFWRWVREGLEMWLYLSEMFCSRLCSVLVIARRSLGVEEPCNKIEITR